MVEPGHDKYIMFKFRTLTFTIALLCSISSAGAQVPAAAPNYVIGADDVLIVTSYDQSDLSGEFRVEADGTFGYPLIGRVAVAGLTLAQAEGALRQGLSDRGFFKQPQLTVAIKEYRSRRIFILGEVRKPGVHALSGQMRLVEALALADSTLPTAGPEVVILPADSDNRGRDNEGVVRISLRELETGDASQNVLLRDGDTIMVPRAEEIYVFGQVKSPGAYSVRDDDMTVLQALSLAGGLTDRGAMGRIEIVRVVEGERQQVKVTLGDAIRPGDTIIVPERFF
jgi:polysaccharide export outer membrane protein